MGSSENLRKFNFKLVRNVNGLVDIRFELKQELDDFRETFVDSDNIQREGSLVNSEFENLKNRESIEFTSYVNEIML